MTRPAHWKLTPVYDRPDPRPYYNARPIEHITWTCPNCDSTLDHVGTHDVSDGVQTQAVPDQWWCPECDYTWTE